MTSRSGIVWTEQAAAHIEHVFDYVATSSGERVAGDVISGILTATERLEKFPLSGRKGRIAGTRELVISGSPFVIAYTVQQNRVVILAVYHAAQKWPEGL